MATKGTPNNANSAAGKPPKRNARTKLLDAALGLIRERGYSATTVDELCQAAGVTKGAFFHHFKSKQALGVAAAEHWSTVTGGLFEGAPYHLPADPLDRVLAYVDFRGAIMEGQPHEYTCLVGTMVQETFDSDPPIRDACCASIFGHASTLEADIESAIEAHGLTRSITDEWDARSLALHTQAVLQGAFILAKASGDVGVAKQSVRHLRRYIELLFSNTSARTDLTSEHPHE